MNLSEAESDGPPQNLHGWLFIISTSNKYNINLRITTYSYVPRYILCTKDLNYKIKNALMNSFKS